MSSTNPCPKCNKLCSMTDSYLKENDASVEYISYFCNSCDISFEMIDGFCLSEINGISIENLEENI